LTNLKEFGQAGLVSKFECDTMVIELEAVTKLRHSFRNPLLTQRGQH
jgi:hypothetical protein